MNDLSTPVAPAPNYAAIKQRQQATWASGDYAVVGTTLQIVGESLAEAVDVRADERVLDVDSCRQTYQREILKSRHYILNFLARRGFLFREGTNSCTPH